MFRFTRGTVLSFLLTLASVVSAQSTQHTISPGSGPVAGGQEVLITGDFGTWPYSIDFGNASVPAVRIDGHTLRAVTPPHPPGTVRIVIFEYDIRISTDLEYTFVDSDDAFERILLPIHMPPVPGAHGSEFRTDFRAMNVAYDESLHVYGLLEPCPPGVPLCARPDDMPYAIAGLEEIEPEDVVARGTPGAFLQVAREEADSLFMQLRAYDVSRDTTNFGTEIPIVHEHEFAGFEPLTLLGIPSDSRFRNTLRIYGTAATTVLVRIEANEGFVEDRVVQLEATGDPAFSPAYVQISNLPTDRGLLRVTIQQFTPVPETPIHADIWAFISVTNNDTQHITVISPQR